MKNLKLLYLFKKKCPIISKSLMAKHSDLCVIKSTYSNLTTIKDKLSDH